MEHAHGEVPADRRLRRRAIIAQGSSAPRAGRERATTRSDPARTPIVSVVIPCWNVEPYLRECLDSVLAQTIGLEHLQVVAVDDGSTDGSAAILDDYAARHPEIELIRLGENSGGPGRPRNVALDHATAPFVFFLDADDYLGPEALARLVATAERLGSDIVLAKLVGVAGRLPPSRWAFRRNIDRASVVEVYDTGNVFKLFRRSLIERAHLRFEEGLPSDEDGPFTARAYFEASTISVRGDYDFYYYRSRPDSQTRRPGSYDVGKRIARIESHRMALVAAYRKPGIGRDVLMIKHIADVLRPFRNGRWVRLEGGERRRVFDVASGVIQRWHTRWIDLALPPWLGIRAYCLRTGLVSELEDIAGSARGAEFTAPLLDRGRIYARWPHFRDSARIPDRYFDITSRVTSEIRVRRLDIDGEDLHVAGEAFLTLLGGSTTLILRRWPSGQRLEFDAEASSTPSLRDRHAAYPVAGFDVTVHLPTAQAGAPIPAGIWRVLLCTRAGLVARASAVSALDTPVPSDAPSVTAPAGPPRRWRIAPTRTGELRLRVFPEPTVTSLLELAIGEGRHLAQRLMRPLLTSRVGRLGLAALGEVQPGRAATLRRSMGLTRAATHG